MSARRMGTGYLCMRAKEDAKLARKMEMKTMEISRISLVRVLDYISLFVGPISSYLVKKGLGFLSLLYGPFEIGGLFNTGRQSPGRGV